MIESLIGLVYLYLRWCNPCIQSILHLGGDGLFNLENSPVLAVCRGQTHWSQILHLHVLLLELEETGLQFLIESFDGDSVSNLHCFNSCIHSSTSETIMAYVSNLGNHLNSNMYSIDTNLSSTACRGNMDGRVKCRSSPWRVFTSFTSSSSWWRLSTSFTAVPPCSLASTRSGDSPPNPYVSCTDTRQTELQLSDSLMRMVAILSQMHGWKKWEEETRAVGYDHTSGKYGFVWFRSALYKKKEWSIQKICLCLHVVLITTDLFDDLA